MTNQHQITPPLKLVQEWMFDLHFSFIPHPDCGQMDPQPHWIELIERAAQWGADQELEACIEWFDSHSLVYHRDLEEELRAARRPKPPSLKEQALETLSWIESEASYDKPMFDTIRRALEALPK